MPLYLNWTPTTPTSSEAFAVTVIVPETVAPDAGEVMATVGGLVSVAVWLATVMVTGAEVVWLPAASRATAVKVYDPSGTLFVYAVAEYGAVVSSASKLMPL